MIGFGLINPFAIKHFARAESNTPLPLMFRPDGQTEHMPVSDASFMPDGRVFSAAVFPC